MMTVKDERRIREGSQGFWIFSVRIGTLKPKTTTKQMQEKMKLKLSQIKEVGFIEIEEDYNKDPLPKPLSNVNDLKKKTECT